MWRARAVLCWIAAIATISLALYIYPVFVLPLLVTCPEYGCVDGQHTVRSVSVKVYCWILANIKAGGGYARLLIIASFR